jgi:hypothetical protein
MASAGQREADSMARAETARVKELESILEQRSSDLSDANERCASPALQAPPGWALGGSRDTRGFWELLSRQQFSSSPGCIQGMLLIVS